MNNKQICIEFKKFNQLDKLIQATIVKYYLLDLPEEEIREWIALLRRQIVILSNEDIAEALESEIDGKK